MAEGEREYTRSGHQWRKGRENIPARTTPTGGRTRCSARSWTPRGGPGGAWAPCGGTAPPPPVAKGRGRQRKRGVRGGSGGGCGGGPVVTVCPAGRTTLFERRGGTRLA
eukprot:1056113-Prorocentrum_minimum.AAC.1